ncbi:response regulator [Methanoculleus sp. CWC-02]|uniref:Response regulator n=1 Tax=Methanoculleus oceani TaxID=2184756 RepID=A0ABD4TFB7_9EURY|nr:response regulator [Methanoculleus sp. CWC-02]MCM2466855.1 response regulator [Methanoculleus sp. CWC-02]
MNKPDKNQETPKVIEILLVEDSPADIALTQEALLDSKLTNNLHVVTDGEEAMAFLQKHGRYAAAPKPDLILLDLNLPRKSGREVLAEIKANERLSSIPVVVMTISQDERDICESYRLHANCYIRKPLNFEEFIKIVQSIEDFWFSIVTLPPRCGE